MKIILSISIIFFLFSCSEVESDNFIKLSIDSNINKSKNDFKNVIVFDSIIALSNNYKPTSLDMLKSLKKDSVLYDALYKTYLYLTEQESIEIVNNISLIQYYFEIEEECIGYDIKCLTNNDVVIKWVYKVLVAELNYSEKTERFGIDVLYKEIINRNNFNYPYNAHLTNKIRISLDSCYKYYK